MPSNRAPIRSRALCAPTLLLVAWLGASCTWTAEPPAPQVPGVEIAALTVEQLQERLPRLPSVVLREGKLWWDDGKGAAVEFALVDPAAGNPVLETASGRLAVDRKLVADARTEAIALVPGLAAAAKGAAVPLDSLLLREGIITGLHLRSDNILVLPEGVLRKADVPAQDRAGDRDAVGAVITRLTAALDGTKLDDLGRKTVIDVLQRLNAEDGRVEADEVAPSFARRVIRFGWLEHFAAGVPAAKDLLASINAAESFRPATLFAGTTPEGKPIRLVEVKDAYNRGGWMLSTPTLVRYTRPHPEPMSHWGSSKLSLVVELPAGSDPTKVGIRPRAAKVLRAGQTVASWSATGGFSVDEPAWREVVPGRGHKGVDRNAVNGFVPPHIAVVDLDGDAVGLLTAQGWLAAPNGETKDSERFLKEAAEQLRDPSGRVPDAAYIDLVGEHLFAYVYDSPDSRFPLLIGNKNVKGDIHQTSQQTLGTAAGGIVRGDCDDAAELFWEIAQRQGRNPIVLSLPRHAAAAWAEKRDEGKWHVYVLQTGPALEFTHELLPKALELAYKAFDESDAFDPNGLGLLLRFSGENTRSSWRLSYRIFAEPDYARTMIDVQRDWHFQTYQRGINTMKEMIAKGDLDTANYRELSGLYSFTGQYDLAAEYHRKAIDATPEPESRFYMQIELLGHLFDAGKVAEARALANELIDKDLPALRPKLGGAIWQAGIQLTGVLSRHDSADLAERIVETTLLDKPTDKMDSLATQIANLAAYARSPKFDESRWENDPKIAQFKRLSGEYAGTVIGLVKEAGVARLTASPVLQETAAGAQLWLDAIAFKDVDETAESSFKYVSTARWYEALLGSEAFSAMVEAAPLPAPDKDTKKDHAKRIGGVAQLSLDLPWIRGCSPYWVSRIQELFSKEAKTLDKALVARLAVKLEEARANELKLGIESPALDHSYHLGRLVAALVAQDVKTIRERLRLVADKNDKRLRDDTAQWLGDSARFLPIDWYTQVLSVWKQELNYKPKWYWIAWRAALNGGTQQALLTAKLAADEFKDDPAFTEEYDFMRKLYEPAVKAPSAVAPAPVLPVAPAPR